MNCTNTKAYISFERDVKFIDQIPKYKNVLGKWPEEMTKEDWDIWNEYNKEISKLFKQMEEDSYKELLDLFYKTTGYSLELLEVDYDDFKLMVDENLSYDEEVYDLYFPDMIAKFQNIGEIWFEQTNQH